MRSDVRGDERAPERSAVESVDDVAGQLVEVVAEKLALAFGPASQQVPLLGLPRGLLLVGPSRRYFERHQIAPINPKGPRDTQRDVRHGLLLMKRSERVLVAARRRPERSVETKHPGPRKDRRSRGCCV